MLMLGYYYAMISVIVCTTTVVVESVFYSEYNIYLATSSSYYDKNILLL